MAQDVLRYLLQHPDATDSAAGIKNWWLKRSRFPGQSEMEEILKLMVRQGWLIETKAGASPALYGLHTGRSIAEIEVFLNLSD